jgi:hypothetical protein
MSPAMWVARTEARILVREMFDEDVVITSGRRPQTPGGSSLHQVGQAMDIRSREWSHDQQRALARELQDRLGEDFDVIVEGPASLSPRYQQRVPHIHIEYDPKGRHADG